jgi:hypothetical protein
MKAKGASNPHRTIDDNLLAITLFPALLMLLIIINHFE